MAMAIYIAALVRVKNERRALSPVRGILTRCDLK
jgi:hypothetical protein